jgi:hypothetical protein
VHRRTFMVRRCRGLPPSRRPSPDNCMCAIEIFSPELRFNTRQAIQNSSRPCTSGSMRRWRITGRMRWRGMIMLRCSMISDAVKDR